MSEEQWGYLVWGILAGIVAFPEVLAAVGREFVPLSGFRPHGGLPPGPEAAPDDGPARPLRRPDRPHHLVPLAGSAVAATGPSLKGGGTFVHRPPIPGSWTLRRGNGSSIDTWTTRGASRPSPSGGPTSGAGEVIPFTAPVKKLEQEPTARELEVLQLISEGLVNREIGHRLFLSEETVKSHVRHLLAKLQARSRAHAVAVGLRRGLIA